MNTETTAASTIGAGVQTLTVPAGVFGDLIAGASIAAHSKPDLPALYSVSISAAGGVMRAAATDRYRLIYGEISTGESDLLDAAIISLPDIKRIGVAIKALSKSWGRHEITLSRLGDTLTVGIAGDSLTINLIGATFPPYLHLFDGLTPAPVETVAYNPLFLASFAKVPSSNTQPMNTFTFNGEGKPVRVSVPHDLITWHALLMPMRISK